MIRALHLADAVTALNGSSSSILLTCTLSRLTSTQLTNEQQQQASAA